MKSKLSTNWVVGIINCPSQGKQLFESKETQPYLRQNTWADISDIRFNSTIADVKPDNGGPHPY